ncbi:hyccin isoform X3 [Heliangelus exortis]|uniref:hyccin isoform X3 n=1 Tax=Heliangelus exortis TaxID=472823 RepID=UPI003A8C9ACE
MLAVDTGVVEEWLSEFKTLPEASISSYAANLKDKSTLISSLYKVIQNPQSEEIVDKEGHSKELSFTIPSLSKPSVYHEPSSIGSMALTEGALSQHGLSRVVYSGPHPQREMLTAQNRFEVLTFLLLCYNAALSHMPAVSLQSLCQICSRICVCGYPRQKVRKYNGVNSRIPVSSEFMVQMLTGIYYAFYNGEWDLARKAMDDILYRAQLELYPEPLLVANAIKASLPQGSMKSSKEGTRCIQVEITPTSSRISRNAVTSMSIRGHRWKRHEQPENGNTDLANQEDLIEVSETDEGFYSRATSNTSQSALSNSSNTSSKNLLGKSQRRSGGSKTGGKEKEGESCREHLSRKQTQRAMSENLELVSLKRLTLTTSQSLPKPGSHSLARTTTTVFSKSFEQVSGVSVPNNRGSVAGTEANRFSACSLQEEKLIYGTERADLPVLSKQPNQQRPPSISITLSTD